MLRVVNFAFVCNRSALSSKVRAASFLALLFGLLGLGSGCKKPALSAGETLARTHCSGCHLFPEPALLEQRDWKDILDHMGLYLGYDDAGLLEKKMNRPDLSAEERAAVIDRRMLPKAPLLSADDWLLLRKFYAANARPPLSKADERIPPPPLPENRFGLVSPEVDDPTSLVFLARIRAETRQVYVGDARHQTISVLSNSGRLIRRAKVPGIVVGVDFPGGDDLLLTMLGSWKTLNTREGKVLFARRSQDGYRFAVLLDNLYRTASAESVDVAGDARPDFLVAQFGHQLGHLSIFERVGPEQTASDARPGGAQLFKEHVLLNLPGAVKAQAVDLDGDGRPEVVALFAQAREGLYVFRRGLTGWRAETVVERPPVWGYTDFVVADLDGDGRPDISTVNGDNAEIFRAPLKDYHGLQFFRNEGARFREVGSFPLHGAYRAVALDYDLDGDLDLAVVAFFPDFSADRPLSLVLLENLQKQDEHSRAAEQARSPSDGRVSAKAHLSVSAGPLRFLPWRIAGAECGRWATVDAADLNGDGDPDLVLGGADVPGMVGYEIKRWRTSRACPRKQSVLILRNNLR